MAQILSFAAQGPGAEETDVPHLTPSAALTPGIRRYRFFVNPVLPLVCLILLCTARISDAAAHPGNIPAALAKVQASGVFEVRLRFDVLAYALSDTPTHIGDAPMEALLDGPPGDLERRLAEAKTRFRHSFRVGRGGGETIDTLTFPNAAEVLQSVAGRRTRLPVMASVTVTGHLPPETRSISFRFDEVLGAVVLTTEFPYREPVSEPIEPGLFSAEQPIPSVESTARAAAAAKAPMIATTPAPAPSPAGKATPVPFEKPKPRASASPGPNVMLVPRAALQTPTPSPIVTASPTPTPSPSPSPSPVTAAAVATATPTATPPAPDLADVPVPSPPRRLTHFFSYVRMGFTHILPEGVDHILFILGLFLLGTRLKPLLLQVTAFTLAHSLTLALSLLGFVHLPAAVVEPVIAASIAFVAIENLFVTDMKPWRVAVVFVFGLIHGMGFGAALQSVGLKQENLVTALLGFNIGVELGQLTVVAAALALVGRFRNHPDYRRLVVVPGSLAIAVIALYWTFQRLPGG